MAITSLALTTSATASGANLWDLAAPAAQPLRVLELHIFMNTAVATKVGLFRTSAIGTRTSPTTYNNEDPGDQTPVATSALTFSVQPTLASTAVRRATLPANVGAGFIWTWGPRGLVIAKSGSIVLANTAGATIGLMEVTAVVDE